MPANLSVSPARGGTSDPLLTPEQAANYLAVRPQTLALWRSTSRYALPWVKVGRAIRYKLCDLEKWVAENTVTPSAVGGGQ